jgi:hypothetical protein
MTAAAVWRDLASAPEDEPVLLATTGEWVGEASMLLNIETNEPEWTWAAGFSVRHAPLGWMPLPAGLDLPVTLTPTQETER